MHWNLFNGSPTAAAKQVARQFLDGLHWPHVDADIRRAIEEALSEKGRVTDWVQRQGCTPEQAALLIVADVVSGRLRSGLYHLAQGALNQQGQALLALFDATNECLVMRGYLSRSDDTLSRGALSQDISRIDQPVVGGV